MLLSREQILAQDDLPSKYIDVPEWGDGAQLKVQMIGTLSRMRVMRAQSAAATGRGGEPEPTALLMALGCVGEDGRPVFTVQDCDALAEKRGDVVTRIAEAVLDVSGMGDDEAEEAGKDSEPTPNGASSTDSLETSDGPSES